MEDRCQLLCRIVSDIILFALHYPRLQSTPSPSILHCPTVPYTFLPYLPFTTRGYTGHSHSTLLHPATMDPALLYHSVHPTLPLATLSTVPLCLTLPHSTLYHPTLFTLHYPRLQSTLSPSVLHYPTLPYTILPILPYTTLGCSQHCPPLSYITPLYPIPSCPIYPSLPSATLDSVSLYPTLPPPCHTRPCPAVCRPGR